MLDLTKLHEYSTQNIVGDGNCMYCAISLDTFDTQYHHLYLRLATAIEKRSVFIDRAMTCKQEIIREKYAIRASSSANTGRCCPWHA
ncbi:hypothetical protein LSAT2_031542, partial [Lamellibrachia satsuma]